MGARATRKTSEMSRENDHAGDSSWQRQVGEAKCGRGGAREDKIDTCEITVGRGEKQRRGRRHKLRHAGHACISVGEVKESVIG